MLYEERDLREIKRQIEIQIEIKEFCLFFLLSRPLSYAILTKGGQQMDKFRA